MREPRQTTSKHETLYIIGKGWRNISGIKYSPFQLLIVALVWVGIAQRRRNNLITTNKINKKVNCKKLGETKVEGLIFEDRGDCSYKGSRVCDGAIVQSFR